VSLRNLLLKDFWLKLASLFLALAIWAYAVSRGDSEMGVVVPLELRNIPPGLVVVGDVVSTVELRLKGQERILKRLAPDQVSVFIDLENAGPGKAVYHLTVQNVRLPANVFVTRITPSVIQLQLDSLQRRRVPIRAVVRGKPAPGYGLGSVRVAPRDVLLEGSRRALKGLRVLLTQPVDVTGAKTTVQQQVPLRLPETETLRVVERIVPRVTVEIVPESRSRP